jgi:filamentous hemagglutinin family protein
MFRESWRRAAVGWHRGWRVALLVAMCTLGSGFTSAHGQAPLPVPCASGVCTTGPATFVSSGLANYVVTGNVGTITQQSERAILNWRSFDIDAGSRVEFRQPSSSSAALNRIYQGDPSSILGSLDANGQVYLINPNGIVFGGSSQVNVRGLLASSLDVTDRIFNEVGITGAINLGDNPGAAQAAFEGGSRPDAAIRIERNARLRADERILIIAPEIVNSGTIETPGGQAILAASQDRVYLASDRELRGLLVEVDTGGSVSNLGSVIAERGNVTLAGLAVNQSGRLTATTSVNVNGSVRLLARDGAEPSQFTVSARGERQPVASRAGTLTLGSASVTEVRPDLESDERATDGQEQLRSRIEGMGRTVEVRSGARVTATGGEIELTATSRPAQPLSGTDRGATLFIGAGSVIDASGEDSAVVAMERNQASIRLFGNELADAPLQREGPLAREEITVDLRVGTPLTDITRLREDVRRGVGERLSGGGSIVLAAEGDTVLQPGAAVDVTGGQVRYLDGFLETSRLVALDGSIVDIADADPGVPYVGIAGRYDTGTSKWGVTDRVPIQSLSRFQPGYVEGRDAGSVTISGANVVLGGVIAGGITRGRFQRDPATAGAAGLARAYTEIPLRGLLSVSRTGSALAGGPTVLFTDAASGAVPDFGVPLPADTPLLVPVRTLLDGSINRLTVSSTGALELPEEIDLTLEPGAVVNLTAGSLRIDGDVRSSSGRLSLQAIANSTAPGALVVGPGAQIDVSGDWVNDSAPSNGGRVGTAPRFLAGGAVSMQSQGDLTLAAGSLVNVDAGASLGASGILRPGSAGSITLSSAIPNQAALTTLDLQGELRGFGFGTGGALTLSAAAVRIRPGGGAGSAGELVLAPEDLTAGGFGRIALAASRGGFLIEDGTTLLLQPLALQVRDGAAQVASGSDIEAVADRVVLPELERGATSLSATVSRAPGVPDSAAALRVGDGAEVLTESGGTIRLNSDSDLYVGGMLRAPGGEIALTLSNPSSANERGYRASQAIRLGPGALLDASASARVVVDADGLRVGEVTDGGQVSLTATRGYVITSAGSRIDVSGTATVLDLPAAPDGAAQPTQISSDAGRILIQAAEGALLSGDLRALRGGPSAAGGTLSLRLDALSRDPNDVAANPVLPQFPLAQRQVLVGGAFDGLIGEGVAVPENLHGLAFLPASMVTAGGFDDLELAALPLTRFGSVTSPGAIVFNGSTSLAAGRRIVLDAAVIASIGQSARVSAPYVAIGPTERRFRAVGSAAAGNGTLEVRAEHIDLVGSTVLSGFAVGGGRPSVELVSSGDIRMIGARFGGETSRTEAGSLTSLADLALSATRIYPATLTEFAIDVLAQDGRIIVEGGRAADLQAPLSAGGSLRLSAAEIVQGGALWAPFGTIELAAARQLELAAASLTSTSGAGAVIPFGITEFGEAWIYPLGDVTRVLDGTPVKSITLESPSVALSEGSTVDVSGGGDLLAYEFIRGPGGSRDVLLGDNPEEAFAILPGMTGLFGVFDPYESPVADIRPGSTVRLAGGGGVPAGEYARLPAHYALLPGAFLVTPMAGYDGLSPTAPVLLADGATSVVAGRLASAGTAVEDARWSGFMIQDGTQVRARSEFVESRASAFFAGGAVPRDAGSLVIDADLAVRLEGVLAAATDGGRAALVDLVADRIAVVTERSGATDRVELVDAELQTFGAASLLLGGVRRPTDGVLRIDAGAASVAVDRGVRLEADELLLVATDEVTIGPDARLAAQDSQPAGAAQRLLVAGNGGLVRVSSGELASLIRTDADGAAGDVVLASDAVLEASGSINLDASRDLQVGGELRTAGGSLDLAASRISLGEAPSGTQGLVLTRDDLGRLDARQLVLRSAATIDVYAGVEAQFDRLRLEGAGLRGFASGESSLAATTFEIANPLGRTAGTAGTGAGLLEIDAGSLQLGPGDVTIDGFSSTSITTRQDLVGLGTGTLDVRGDLRIDSVRITGSAAADLLLTASGRITTVTHEPAAGSTLPPPALGARIRLAAESIDHGGRIDAPSGIVELRASGASGVTLSDSSVIDAGGHVLDFGPAAIGSPGGRVSIAADAGDVRINDGAVVRVATTGPGGPAGRLVIDAGAALSVGDGARISGGAEAGERQGSFELRARSLDSPFGSLNRLLNDGGFVARRSISLETGDIEIGATDVVRAADLELSAGSGGIEVAGRIDATAERGGRVRLAAADDVLVLGSARIDAAASAAGERGGVIELQSASGRVRVLPAAAGARTLLAGGRDAAGVPLDGGRILLRAPRVGPDGAAFDVATSSIGGASSIDFEAFGVYETDVLTAAGIAAIGADTSAYMANRIAILDGLGLSGDSRARLVAGVEVRSAGDLVLASDWDLVGWRYDGAGGVLTLRAGGDLRLERSLSDGFAQRAIDPLLPARDVVQNGPGWTYRLVAGAAGGGDALAAGGSGGDLVVGPDVHVRTGTGDIDAVAGSDFILASATSALYTAGENRGTGALDPFDAEVLLRGDFVYDGGSIRIRAGGDVRGVADRPLPDWQPRASGEFAFYRPGVHFPAAWAIDAAKFVNGVGALGGGNVSVSAGGNVDSLTVALPTNGLPGRFDGSDPQVAGGGRLAIDAGGDLRGGVFHVDRGDAEITAGGEIGRSLLTAGLAPVLGVGDAGFTLRARTGATLETAFNPTVAEPDPTQGLQDYLFFPQTSYFFTYGENSAVRLSTTAGDATLRARGESLARLYGDRQVDPALLSLYPGVLEATSLQGDVVLRSAIDLYPSPRGDLRLLAGRDVTAVGSGSVNLSDGDVRTLPDARNPANVLNGQILRQVLSSRAPTPVHALDDRPALIVARSGRVGTDGLNTLRLDIAKQARIVAGSDILNLSLAVQHARERDLTLLEAVRDIRYSTIRRPDGNLSANSNFIDVAGPGRVDLLAGRDVDFGSAVGVTTRGDLSNPALADSGADVSIWTGRATAADFAGFIERYLEDSSKYAEALAEYLGQFETDPGLSDVEAFRALDESLQREFIQDVFFAELRRGGLGDIEVGFDAISTLFADATEGAYAGDLKSFLSRVTTLDGGDIDILVPGGLVNAGVASAGSISKRPDELGIVVQRAGDVSAFVQSDFLVNSSRVFALDGGDILLWSSEADIDAGRGARSALSIPPPTIGFDAQGNVIIEFPPAISGSGIRTAVTTPGREPGDVFLFAPSGTVDAGDAGIQSAGNITVVAVQVIGADNISAGGVSVGVPVDSGGIGAGLAAASASSTSSASATTDSVAGESAAATGEESLGDSALSWLEVFVIGLGDEQCDQKDMECIRRQKKQP